jgi:hypothetical protein
VVNFIFPYRTATAVGSDNVLASKSLIQIDSIQGGKMNGMLAALSPVGTSQTYSIGGRFQATVCNSVEDAPMYIRQKSSTVLRVVYAEAIKLSNGFEVRLMDRVPKRKCDSFTGWMMTEAPIKYLTMKTPAAAGAFTIARGTVEYGDQGSGTGWSTDAFAGTAKLHNVSATDLLVSLAAKDIGGMGFDIEGAISTSVCP